MKVKRKYLLQNGLVDAIESLWEENIVKEVTDILSLADLIDEIKDKSDDVSNKIRNKYNASKYLVDTETMDKQQIQKQLKKRNEIENARDEYLNDEIEIKTYEKIKVKANKDISPKKISLLRKFVEFKK